MDPITAQDAGHNPAEEENSGNARKVVTIASGVLATSCLVISNRKLLDALGDGAVPASALACAHHVVSLLYYSKQQNSSDSMVTVPRYFFLFIAVISTSSLLLSNLLLQQGSVSIHQLTRLIAMPVGAAVDRILLGIKKTTIESLLLLGMFVCATITISDLGTCTWSVGILACAFLTTYLATAFVTRQLAVTFRLASTDILTGILPYSAATSIFALVIAITIDPFARLPIPSSSTYLMLAVNCCLAVAVQYLTTWTMKHTSLQSYAVTGQLKTALTVIFAVLVFHEKLTVVTFISFVTTILFGCLLIWTEISNTRDKSIVRDCCDSRE